MHLGYSTNIQQLSLIFQSSVHLRLKPRLLFYPPEGLDLRNLFAALAPDLVDVLGCCPHHLLHPLLLQLLLTSLNRMKSKDRVELGGESQILASARLHLQR